MTRIEEVLTRAREAPAAARNRSLVGVMAELSQARDDIRYLLEERRTLQSVVRHLSGWKSGDNVDETVARMEREVQQGAASDGNGSEPRK